MPITIKVEAPADWQAQDADTAETTLEAQGFTVVRLTEFSEDYAVGMVISQTVTALPLGSLVTLVVSLGDPPRFIPSITPLRTRRRPYNP